MKKRIYYKTFSEMAEAMKEFNKAGIPNISYANPVTKEYRVEIEERGQL